MIGFILTWIPGEESRKITRSPSNWAVSYSGTAPEPHDTKVKDAQRKKGWLRIADDGLRRLLGWETRWLDCTDIKSSLDLDFFRLINDSSFPLL